MWRRRNSLSHFTQLATSSSSKFNCHNNLQPTSLRLLQIPDVDQGYGLLTRSSSTAVGPSSNSGKLGISGLDRVRAFGSTADIVGATTLGAREVVDMARHYGRCYWELSKAKLSMLVVATSGAGYVLGSSSTVDLAGLCYTCVGTMMVAASANTLNQVFEVKNDALMNRTMRRPLPSGRLTIPHAVTWASSVGLAGTALLASKANLLAAGLGASNLILYAFVYTPLKQIHPVNTWVGAVVGAIPPLLGWAAASGQVSLNGWLLPAALYFWQIPHFMALAYLCRDDYAAGGFKMFSLADPSGRRTALVALRNCIYLIPLGYLAYDWGITSGWFCLESTLLALAISGTAVSFLKNRTKASARRMFHASLLYLPVFMSGLMFHRIYDDDHQSLETENTKDHMVISHTTTAYEQDSRNPDRVKQNHSRPPVAYASVAPFPFLPAPIYSSS
ncbi:protoheme IX farnesyltransferase, mitochondrial [Cynara cardunculus var. scolymus]|uniref:protoheme IX farnesyltransferase, mitochondrial n=1 Tax=Cynara cardunculus var. scolymus TaxID=59895 RepID=UPI000D6274C1|nr:protoheme IX farnesyltransferase, mitochondrial [Cynara cardunculus var. scolymus]